MNSFFSRLKSRFLCGNRIAGGPIKTLAIIFLCSAILLMAVVGCGKFDKFKPNTLVKTYKLASGQKSIKLDDFEVDIVITARESGRLTGTDSFLVHLDFKSRQSFSSLDQASSIPVPRIDSVQIIIARAENIVLSAQRVDNRSLDQPPSIFRGHLYERFNLKHVFIPDSPRVLTLLVHFGYYDRLTLKRTETLSIERKFVRSQDIRWYKI